jgi:hypothetical protein
MYLISPSSELALLSARRRELPRDTCIGLDRSPGWVRRPDRGAWGCKAVPFPTFWTDDCSADNRYNPMVVTPRRIVR